MRLVDRNTYGVVYGRQDSSRLWIKPAGGKLESTGLPNSRSGIASAKELLQNRWRQAHGVEQSSSTQRIHISKAWKEFTTIHGAGKAKGTIELYTTAYRGIVGEGDWIVTDESVESAAAAFVHAKTVAPATQVIYLRVFNTFANWGIARGMLKKNTVRSIKPRVSPKPIEVYTDDEMNRLIAWFEKCRPEFASLLKFLSLTGWRIHEALELKWEDIHPNHLTRVNKRGDREKPFPLTEHLRAVLKSVPRSKEQKKVFRWKPDTYSRLHRWLKEGFVETKIKQRGRSFHVFRKTLISKLATNGIDLLTASAMMDCSPRIMHQHYARIQVDHMRDALEKISS